MVQFQTVGLWARKCLLVREDATGAKRFEANTGEESSAGERAVLGGEFLFVNVERACRQAARYRGSSADSERPAAHSLYARAASSPHVRPVGLACHIGSQILDLAPLRAAFETMRDMTRALRARGLTVERLDLGGGLGVAYFGGAQPPTPAEYVAMAAAVTPVPQA